ncbi:hypothetical protein ACSSS7_001077 [Eimeria intestinalis]
MAEAELNGEPPRRGAAGPRAREAPGHAAAAVAAAAAAAGNQQQQQQQQRQQQQGRSRRVRFDKNSPNTFTFKLLPAPQQLLRTEAAAGQQQQQRMQLQRIIPPNARDKGLGFRPQQPLPAFLQQQLDRQEIAEEELKRRAEEAAKKGLARDTRKEETEADLAGDCYFPQDGYDYSQHLVGLRFVVNDCSSAFVAFDGGGDRILTEETEGIARMRRDREGRQVLEALEAADEFEEIADDFVAEALTAADGSICAPDEEALLWGSRPPLLPAAVSACLVQKAAGGERDLSGVGWKEGLDEEEEEDGGDSGDCEETDASLKGDTLRRARAADTSDMQADSWSSADSGNSSSRSSSRSSSSSDTLKREGPADEFRLCEIGEFERLAGKHLKEHAG